MKQLAIASGKKWVSLVGLVIAALGFICLDHRADLDAIISDMWTKRVCGAATLAGSLLAALGKGLADRRATRDDNGYYAAPPQQKEK